ncbi:hypothetical protein TNCV_3484751 [Trichonephila clavipes]|nr:hypothetical protein TNCV_3484751 [Trichonephila clavipes]
MPLNYDAENIQPAGQTVGQHRSLLNPHLPSWDGGSLNQGGGGDGCGLWSRKNNFRVHPPTFPKLKKNCCYRCCFQHDQAGEKSVMDLEKADNEISLHPMLQ